MNATVNSPIKIHEVYPYLRVQNLFATLLTLVSAVTCGSQTPPTPSQPAPPPQVKQTVDAVAGHWVGSMTAVLPGPGLRPIPMGNDLQNDSPQLWCGMLDEGDGLDWTDRGSSLGCIRP